jgi:hypothetical protein
MLVWILGVAVGLTAEPPSETVAIVCPAPWVDSLADWDQHRRRKGWKTTFLQPRETGDRTLEELRKLVPRPSYVLLVGDCPHGVHGIADPQKQSPTFYLPTPVMAKFGSTEDCATDFPFADLDGDGLPDAAVGRLPVKDAEQLAKLATRIIAVDSNHDFSNWRRQVHLVAGVGGFGMLADAAIEAATASLLQSSLPGSIQTSLMYASPNSPFFPGYDQFRNQAKQRLNQGSMAWVYIGHGQVTSLDRVPPTADGRPILTVQDIEELQIPANAPPIALMLACYTGAFDARSDSLAERMLLIDQGLIAVISSTRVTMPYGNAVASQAMMEAWFDLRVPCLGDILKHARHALLSNTTPNPLLESMALALSPTADRLAQERTEHAALYNLLGDPTLPVSHPETLVFESPTKGTLGSPISLKVQSGLAGKLVLELCQPLSRVRKSNLFLEVGSSHDPCVLERIELSVGSGETVVQLAGKEGDYEGDYIIRGFLESPAGYAMGSASLRRLKE